MSSNAEIDVHVLLLPTTDPILWRECLQSLENEPVNIHTAEGVPGHIGKPGMVVFQKELPLMSAASIPMIW